MQKSSRHYSSGGDEDSNPYWISFADIMAGLLVLFILAAIALIVALMTQKHELMVQQESFDEMVKVKEKEFEQQQRLVDNLQRTVIEQRRRFEEDVHAAEGARREILYEIQDELRERGINVLVSDNETVLRIPEDVLSFDRAKWDLTEQYSSSVAEIGEVLHSVITKKTNGVSREQFLDTVFVEGHTDSSPFKGFLGYEYGNWPLSSLRAITVWDFWNRELSQINLLDKLKNHAEKPLFSVSGYAGSRPVEDNQTTSENQRKNRRIDIRFTVMKPVLGVLDKQLLGEADK
mgnify:CR=1 FL=1